MKRVNWYAVAGLALCLASAVSVAFLVHWIIGLVLDVVL